MNAPSEASINLSMSKLARSAQKVRKDQRKAMLNVSQSPYTGKTVFKLRERNPTNYIQSAPFKFKAKTENERLVDVIQKIHPIEREGFDIEGYRDYCWRPEDPTRFLASREMTHKLNDLKRTIAEATYKPEPKHFKSVLDVSKIIDESKSTIRSSDPYIGGEKETGDRIFRNRNQQRELTYESERSVHTKSVHRDRILTANYQKRCLLNTSIENSSLKILGKKGRVRPVSAYTYTSKRKVSCLHPIDIKIVDYRDFMISQRAQTRRIWTLDLQQVPMRQITHP